jgi:hypothetical protein
VSVTIPYLNAFVPSCQQRLGVEDLLQVPPRLGAVAAGDVVEPDPQAGHGPGDQQPGAPVRVHTTLAGAGTGIAYAAMPALIALPSLTAYRVLVGICAGAAVLGAAIALVVPKPQSQAA